MTRHSTKAEGMRSICGKNWLRNYEARPSGRIDEVVDTIEANIRHI
jgi:hypothetical protein